MTEESGATCRPGQFPSLGWGESGFRAARPEVAALVPGRVFVIRHESRLERDPLPGSRCVVTRRRAAPHGLRPQPCCGLPCCTQSPPWGTGGERRPAALLWGQTPRSSAETALRAGGACGLRAAPDAPDARRVQGAGRRGAHSPKRWGALHSPGLWPETSALILAVYARGLCSTKDVSQRTCHVKGGSAGGGVATGQRGRGAGAPRCGRGVRGRGGARRGPYRTGLVSL